ncbi:MAG: GNAT family N-acetyltransferase [Micromonosporaceae bacterium]
MARGTVVAGKRVPPWRPGNRRIAALERVAAQGWPAPDTAPLGQWLLRAADGWTSRANSALALGDPGLPLPDALAAVVDWYTGRGLPPRVTTPLPLAAAAADALAAAGWIPQPTVLVQTAPLRAIPGPDPAAADVDTDDGPAVRLATEPAEEWLAAMAERKGALPAAARHVLTAVDEVRFAAAHRDGELLGTARGVVTDGWLGISLVGVAPHARRTGLARRMTHALVRWGRELGATRAYLQVEEDNPAAVALYAGLGFTTHHTYVTWLLSDAPGGAAGSVGSPRTA